MLEGAAYTDLREEISPSRDLTDLREEILSIVHGRLPPPLIRQLFRSVRGVAEYVEITSGATSMTWMHMHIPHETCTCTCTCTCTAQVRLYVESQVHDGVRAQGLSNPVGLQPPLQAGPAARHAGLAQTGPGPSGHLGLAHQRIPCAARERRAAVKHDGPSGVHCSKAGLLVSPRRCDRSSAHVTAPVAVQPMPPVLTPLLSGRPPADKVGGGKPEDAVLRDAALNALQRDAAYSALSTMHELWGVEEQPLPSPDELVARESQLEALKLAASLKVEVGRLRAQLDEMRAVEATLRDFCAGQLKHLARACSLLSSFVMANGDGDAGGAAPGEAHEITELRHSVRAELLAISKALDVR